MTKEDWHQIIDAVHCTSKKILAGLRAVGCQLLSLVEKYLSTSSNCSEKKDMDNLI